MRPDDHKRKKSNQYKKKHGLKTEKVQGEKENKPKGKEPRVESGGKAESQKQAKPVSDSVGASDEAGASRPVFRKRQVVSNWERYGEDPLGEPPEEEVSKGADFAKLQDIIVTPRSGLRLRDEEEWEDSGAGESHHLLSIDVAELAAAVSCLPLHQRLNLDTSLFSKETVAEFEDEARKHRSAYEELIEKSSSQVIHKRQAQVLPLKPTTITESVTIENDQQAQSDPLKVLEESNKGCKISGLNHSSVKEQPVTEVDSSTDGKLSEGSCIEGEDDLDFLLSLDAPTSSQDKLESTSHNMPNHSSTHLTTGTSSKEEENPVCDRGQELSSISNRANNKDSHSQDQGNLEDWLDSVLDS